MADSLILLNRNTPPEGFLVQTVDVLANRPPNYWLWTVGNIDITLTDSQVQAFLDSQATSVIDTIVAGGEVPLTPEQVANYQNVIDLQQTQALLDTLAADRDLINVASPDVNASTGYKDAFKSATYNPLSNAAKFELIRATMFALLGITVDIIKALRIVLKRAKRTQESGSALRTL